MFRVGATVLAALSPTLLSACSPAPQSRTAAAQPGAVRSVTVQTVTVQTVARPGHGKPFTLDTPVSRIAADPQGKAVLVRDMPGLMASKSYALFDDMSLSQIAMLSGGRITKTKLALVQSDLTQISYLPPAN